MLDAISETYLLCISLWLENGLYDLEDIIWIEWKTLKAEFSVAELAEVEQVFHE